MKTINRYCISVEYDPDFSENNEIIESYETDSSILSSCIRAVH